MNELENLRKMLAIAIRLRDSYRSSLNTSERCWALENAATKVSQSRQREKLHTELEQSQDTIEQLQAALAAAEMAQAEAQAHGLN